MGVDLVSNDPSERQGFGRVWLDRGVAAARAGRRVEAREALFRALNDESHREMAWLWLAAVSDDPRQERAYLEKVLSLNPHNEHAKKGIIHLEKRDLKDLPSPSIAVEDTNGAAQDRPARSAADSSPGVSVADPVVVSEKSAQEPAPLLGKEEASGAEPAGDGEPDPVPRGESGAGTEIDVAGSEPTGWTTNSPVVERPRPAPSPALRESSGWTGAAPDVPRQPPVYTRERPVRRQVRRPRPRSDGVLRGKGRFSMMVNEAFGSHEMWAVLASTVGLIVLAVVLALFFVLSLLSG